MIELRWLVDPRSDAHRVLQYRAKDNWGGHNEEPDWGDWQDVPEIVAQLPQPEGDK